MPEVGGLEIPPAQGCPGEQVGQVLLLLPKAPSAPQDMGELMCAGRDGETAVEKCSLHARAASGELGHKQVV